MHARGLTVRRFLALAILVLTLLGAASAGADSRLDGFARGVGIADVAGFAETVAAIARDGRLPPRYLTKEAARALGWKPGMDLCRVAPGKALGGDHFANREKKLPARAGRRWQEADLDYACGRRGAKRLLFSSDGLIYVTLDHYQTFRQVPK
jgi:hypothetical protein